MLAPRDLVLKAFKKLPRLQPSQVELFRSAEFFQRPSREESSQRRVLDPLCAQNCGIHFLVFSQKGSKGPLQPFMKHYAAIMKTLYSLDKQ